MCSLFLRRMVRNMILIAADDKTIILSNQELNDKHIFVALKLSLKQFPSLKGLDSESSPFKDGNCFSLIQSFQRWELL